VRGGEWEGRGGEGTNLPFSNPGSAAVRKWRKANAKSRVDVGDRLLGCRTENIHTRNTLVIGFRLAVLW